MKMKEFKQMINNITDECEIEVVEHRRFAEGTGRTPLLDGYWNFTLVGAKLCFNIYTKSDDYDENETFVINKDIDDILKERE